MKLNKSSTGIILVFTCFLILGCNNSSNQAKGKEDNNSNRKKEINFLLDFFKKSKEKVIDENGFPINYEYSSEIIIKENLGKSNTVSNKGMCRNSMYLELFTAEVVFSLNINGEHQRDIKLAAQIFDLYELNPLGSNPIPKEFSKERKFFFPEIDDIEIRKNIISKITKPQFYQAYFEKNSNDIEMSNEWINVSSTFIKNSKILEYNSL